MAGDLTRWLAVLDGAAADGVVKQLLLFNFSALSTLLLLLHSFLNLKFQNLSLKT